MLGSTTKNTKILVIKIKNNMIISMTIFCRFIFQNPTKFPFVVPSFLSYCKAHE